MLSVFGLCMIAGLLVPAGFCTLPVRAYSVMLFDRGGQAIFVARERMLVIFLSLATRLVLVTQDRRLNKWVEVEPLQETGKESRYVTGNGHADLYTAHPDSFGVVMVVDVHLL
ncbi:hypothetical protein BDY19DRAFT_977442 [Irpex rosettiformis]|uniref:Uncharacterized protein n=2 Tax=Irpex rosettiformis TaxID=378272 RepID=A0ACB8TMU5_9APHY|nr:hypothetical protein BDY19DRAFT_979214 [Irpex rosettiformis]KAI0083522.1 hypothetical protein BDY19DRAFT_977442 [Irpex rosettiformis]